MPKRKRRDRERTAPADPGAPVDPNVALFAQRHRDELDRQKAEQRAAAEQRRRETEHERLVAAKDDAVARVKAKYERMRSEGA